MGSTEHTVGPRGWRPLSLHNVLESDYEALEENWGHRGMGGRWGSGVLRVRGALSGELWIVADANHTRPLL